MGCMIMCNSNNEKKTKDNILSKHVARFNSTYFDTHVNTG